MLNVKVLMCRLNDPRSLLEQTRHSANGTKANGNNFHSLYPVKVVSPSDPKVCKGEEKLGLNPA